MIIASCNNSIMQGMPISIDMFTAAVEMAQHHLQQIPAGQGDTSAAQILKTETEETEETDIYPDALQAHIAQKQQTLAVLQNKAPKVAKTWTLWRGGHSSRGGWGRGTEGNG